VKNTAPVSATPNDMPPVNWMTV